MKGRATATRICDLQASHGGIKCYAGTRDGESNKRLASKSLRSKMLRIFSWILSRGLRAYKKEISYRISLFCKRETGIEY